MPNICGFFAMVASFVVDPGPGAGACNLPMALSLSQQAPVAQGHRLCSVPIQLQAQAGSLAAPASANCIQGLAALRDKCVSRFLGELVFSRFLTNDDP